MLFSKESHGYVYKWTELSTGKWYIGSRSAKNCHINDGYICSSKIVKPLIQNNPDNLIREILWIGERISTRNIETMILLELNAALCELSYNQTNSDGKFHTIGKVPHNKGKKLTAEQRLLLRGRTHSPETIERLKKSKENISESTKKKISYAKRGCKPWNKGIPRTQSEIDKMSASRKRTADEVGAWNKGIPHSIETKQKIKLKALSRKKCYCKFCDKNITVYNFNKWHGDKCIKNPNSEKRVINIKNHVLVTCEYCEKTIQYRSYIKNHGNNCKHNIINNKKE